MRFFSHKLRWPKMKNFYHLIDSRFKFFRHWDVIRSWDHQKCLTAVERAMEMAQRVLGKGLHTKDFLNQWKVSTCLVDLPEIEWNKRQKKNVLITVPSLLSSFSFSISPLLSTYCTGYANLQFGLNRVVSHTYRSSLNATYKNNWYPWLERSIPHALKFGPLSWMNTSLFTTIFVLS